MKLFVVHCGFYDSSLSEGDAPNIYEGHHNFYVAAENASYAKNKVKEKSAFMRKKMHVDGIHELDTVDGFKVELTQTAQTKSQIRGHDFEASKTI